MTLPPGFHVKSYVAQTMLIVAQAKLIINSMRQEVVAVKALKGPFVDNNYLNTALMVINWVCVFFQ